MSRWKCGICGDEFENYHAQGFDDIIYCPLCYFKEEYKRTNEMLKTYKKQLQQKENIIKEVREYIRQCIRIIHNERTGTFENDVYMKEQDLKEFLEILDKEKQNETTI